MTKKDHDNPPPLVPVVSDDESDDDSIGANQVSELEPIGNNGPPARPIPPEPPPHQSL